MCAVLREYICAVAGVEAQQGPLESFIHGPVRADGRCSLSISFETILPPGDNKVADKVTKPLPPGDPHLHAVC